MRVPQYPVGGAVPAAEQPAVTASPFAPAEAFGGGDAQSLGQVGRALGEAAGLAGALAIRQQREVNETRARDALTQARARIHDHLVNETFKRKGKDAEHVLETAQDYLSNLRGELSETLDNARQRDIFGVVFAEHATEALERVATYQAGEQERWRQESLQGAIAVTLRSAGLLAAKPEALGALKAELLGDVAALHRGKDAQAVAAEALQALSLFHVTVGEQLALQNYRQALDYVKANRNEISPPVYAKVVQEWERVAPIQEGEKLALELWFKGGETLPGAQAELSKRGLPQDVRENATRRLHELARQQEAAYSLNDAVASRALAQILEKMPDDAPLADIMTAIDQLPFAPDTRQRLRMGFQDAREKAKAAGLKNAQEMAYNRLLVESALRPESLLGIKPADLLQAVGAEHFTTINNIRLRYVEKLDDQVDKVGQVAAQLAQMQFPRPTEKGGATPEAILKWDADMSRAIMSARRSAEQLISEKGNKRLTEDEIASVARSVLTEWKYHYPSVWKSDVRFQLTEQGDVRVREAATKFRFAEPRASTWEAMRAHGVTEDHWEYRLGSGDVPVFRSNTPAAAEAYLVRKYGQPFYPMVGANGVPKSVRVLRVDVDILGRLVAVTDADTGTVYQGRQLGGAR